MFTLDIRDLAASMASYMKRASGVEASSKGIGSDRDLD